MSFVPAPQQANAASARSNAPVTSGQAASAATEAPVSDQELTFKIRTFDVFWVDKQALMYKDGIAKVRRTLRDSCRARKPELSFIARERGSKVIVMDLRMKILCEP